MPSIPRRTRRDQHLPLPADEEERDSVAWREIERSFDYFSRGAAWNRLVYLALRWVVIATGAIVPILALAGSNDVLVATLGAIIVVAEATTQLTQVHAHWIRYRRTAEAIRREALAFVSRTGAYQVGELTATQRLASRLADVTDRESSEWEETARAGIDRPTARADAVPAG